MREATILVNERPSSAEAGEGGFEELILDRPRGYVEPAPRTFEAIASLYEALAKRVATMTDLGDGAEETPWQKDAPLRKGILDRLTESAAEARRFGQMAERSFVGETLSDAEYDAIRDIGGSAEHQFLLYKSLAEKALAISIPEPIGKIADVAGDLKRGVLEVAVGNPLAWFQITPYFGRRQITIGSTYSYYEFYSKTLYDNDRWRTDMGNHQRPRGFSRCSPRRTRRVALPHRPDRRRMSGDRVRSDRRPFSDASAARRRCPTAVHRRHSSFSPGEGRDRSHAARRRGIRLRACSPKPTGSRAISRARSARTANASRHTAHCASPRRRRRPRCSPAPDSAPFRSRTTTPATSALMDARVRGSRCARPESLVWTSLIHRRLHALAT